MKKGLFILCLSIIILAGTCFGQDKSAGSLSLIVTDSLIYHYTAMVNNSSSKLSDQFNFNDKLTYLTNNKDFIASEILQADAFNHLGHAHQIFDNLYRKNTSYLPYTQSNYKVNGKANFDSRTGHKYVKHDQNAYLEYTKKGEFLKTIESDKPIFSQNKSIYPIRDDSYILYEKSSNGQLAYMSLPGFENHPKGWKAYKILTALY